MSAFFQLGAEGQYANFKYTDLGTEQKYSALSVGGALRLFWQIPNAVTLAAGPYFDAGSAGNISGTANYADIRILHVGGELAVFADRIASIIYVNPYLRAGYGYEQVAVKATGIEIFHGAAFHALGGISCKIFPWVHAYIDAGITSSGWRAALGTMIWFEWQTEEKTDAALPASR